MIENEVAGLIVPVAVAVTGDGETAVNVPPVVVIVMLDEGKKPLDAVTVKVPGEPLCANVVVDKVAVAGLSVKVLLPVLWWASVTETVIAPGVSPGGTVTVKLHVPVEVTVVDDGVTAIPPIVTEVIEFETVLVGAKLDPVTVRTVPIGPLVGVKLTLGLPVMNEAAASWAGRAMAETPARATPPATALSTVRLDAPPWR